MIYIATYSDPQNAQTIHKESITEVKHCYQRKGRMASEMHLLLTLIQLENQCKQQRLLLAESLGVYEDGLLLPMSDTAEISMFMCICDFISATHLTRYCAL